MKVYQIVDNATLQFITTNRLKMLEALYELHKKYEDKGQWFDVSESELK